MLASMALQVLYNVVDSAFVANMENTGAAWATIIGQFVSLFMSMAFHYRLNKNAYENATSKAVMTQNPKMKAALPHNFSEQSGIRSLTHTHSIAPAEKASANGCNIISFEARSAPISPKTGSTAPLKVPIANAFNLLPVQLFTGSAVAKPSGKFCKPIPKATPKAIPGATGFAPYAKPTAIPSGIL